MDLKLMVSTTINIMLPSHICNTYLRITFSFLLLYNLTLVLKHFSMKAQTHVPPNKKLILHFDIAQVLALPTPHPDLYVSLCRHAGVRLMLRMDLGQT